MIPRWTEMRCWLLLGLLILWGGVVALAWEVWQGWPPTPDVPLDVLLHQARTRVDHSLWYILVVVPYGVLLCTRAIWWVLRQETRTRIGWTAAMGTRRPAMRPACDLDRLVASIRVRLRVCTVLAGLNLLGTLLVLALVLTRH